MGIVKSTDLRWDGSLQVGVAVGLCLMGIDRVTWLRFDGLLYVVVVGIAILQCAS
jgi:hypothetical protein